MPLPYKLATLGSSIVVLGDFNPAIFSPEWLHRNGLIGDDDLESARSKDTLLVSRQVSVCDTDQLHLQALEKRLELNSLGALTPALKDLAEGILRLLSHTPVTALGMNFHAHYEMASKDDWNKVGDTLAPKDVWKDLFDEAQYSAGLASLQIMIQHGAGQARENPADAINVQVQPSIQVKQGVYIMLNDHRASFAQAEGNETTAERAAGLVSREWEQTWKLATRTFETLLTKILGPVGD